MNPNQTKAKLQSEEPAIGLISGSPDPSLVEFCALGGFDFYMLDGEHGLINPESALTALRTCEATSMTPLIRLGPKDPKLILQYVDAGFMGIMMPELNSPEELAMLVNAIKYPPIGQRGLGSIRANLYHAGERSVAEYIDFSNQETLVITQFEDPDLLPVLPELCGVPEIDVVMIGPR